jgi:hypothetical protein
MCKNVPNPASPFAGRGGVVRGYGQDYQNSDSGKILIRVPKRYEIVAWLVNNNILHLVLHICSFLIRALCWI